MPQVFNRGGLIAASSGLLGAGAAIVGPIARSRQSRLAKAYGSARWAKPSEIHAAGLRRPSGVFLGRLGEGHIRHDGPEHVMAFAPTRSGKGVGLVVPTLLTWPSSAVIHDIKGENWQLNTHHLGDHPHALRQIAYTRASSCRFFFRVRCGRSAQKLSSVSKSSIAIEMRRMNSSVMSLGCMSGSPGGGVNVTVHQARTVINCCRQCNQASSKPTDGPPDAWSRSK